MTTMRVRDGRGTVVALCTTSHILDAFRFCNCNLPHNSRQAPAQ